MHENIGEISFTFLLTYFWPIWKCTTQKCPNLKRNGYVYIHNWLTLLYTWDHHTFVSQLYSNTIYFLKSALDKKVLLEKLLWNKIKWQKEKQTKPALGGLHIQKCRIFTEFVQMGIYMCKVYMHLYYIWGYSTLTRKVWLHSFYWWENESRTHYVLCVQWHRHLR